MVRLPTDINPLVETVTEEPFPNVMAPLTVKAAGKLTKGALEAETKAAHHIASTEKRAIAFRDKVFTAQTALREDIDAMEKLMPKSAWPVPSYADMLFNF